MSFGSSNPPWQRNTLGNTGQSNAIANMQSQMINTNFVGYQGLTMTNQAPQNNLTLIPQLGAGMNQLNNTNTLFANHQAIQYQNRSGLNPNAFGPVQTTQQMMHHQTAANQAPVQANQGNAVTQLCNSSAFKWNAGIVPTNQSHNMNVRSNGNPSQMQHPVQSSQPQSATRNFSAYNSPQSQSNYVSTLEHTSSTPRSSNHPSRQSPPSKRVSPGRSRTRENGDRKRRNRSRERRETFKEQEKRDDRSPVRRISPIRRRNREIPRYMVQVPKVTLNTPEADILELRRRYANLYVPSDFFYTRIRWSESFPCHAPFSIKKPSAFHIFHHSVENPNGDDNAAELEPPDADDSFSAKVMLMSVPPMTEFYRKCFTSAEEKKSDDLLHPSRLISFLVGVMGKNETMAIGGAWSPSLDGKNPDKDPSVLIKTAIRTCKAMTGIDLSPCTQWYRFVELYYRRVETVRKGRTVPARTQTVVIFLPDVRSCLPTRLEWDELTVKYKNHLETRDQSKDNDESLDGDKKLTDETNQENCDDVIEINDESKPSQIESSSGGNDESLDKANETPVVTDSNASTSMAAISKQEGKSEPNKDEKLAESDIKAMKIQELRDHLEVRGLPSKGLKPQLIARLLKACKTVANLDESATTELPTESKVDEEEMQGTSDKSNEMNECASNDDSLDIDLAHIVVIDEYDSTKNDSRDDSGSKRSSLRSRRAIAREQRYLEQRYRLPENPHILCHPSQHSSLKKFTCEVKSLSILLDYRPEDTKRPCFEVSLFAELFNEMLMRDFGFNIYKVLCSLPEMEQPSSEQESKEKRDKDDEPKEKRGRKDEAGNDSKKRDDSSSHDKSKAESDKDSKSTKDSKSRDKDKDKGHRERRTSRKDDDSDDDRSVDGKKRETKKMVTVDPELLLSFVYFDQTQCGYLFSNHLEELFYSLGLKLSRSDAKKITNKVAPRSLFYRKLTDKPKDEQSAAPSELVENVEELSKGNNPMLPNFDSSDSGQSHRKYAEQLSEENTEIDASKDQEADNMGEPNMVMHNGALIDIGKLLQQLNRSEKAREETEVRLTELTRSHAELQASSSKAKDKIRDLQSELKSCNRKLGDTESGLGSTNKKCSEYYSILCGIHDKIAPLIKNERSVSKKESSNRDKDRREREKDRISEASSSKEKDKEKEVVHETKSEIKQEKSDKQDESIN